MVFWLLVLLMGITIISQKEVTIKDENKNKNTIEYLNPIEAEKAKKEKEQTKTVAIDTNKTIDIPKKEVKKETKKEENPKVKTTNEQKKTSLDRGGNGQGRRVEFHITYYTNANTKLEGGQYDKKGKKLTSHGVPIVALPKDVPYGAKVVLDSSVNGATTFKNVDTGGSIVWLNSSKTKCKMDVFVPDVTSSYIEKHYQNKVVSGWLYY